MESCKKKHDMMKISAAARKSNTSVSGIRALARKGRINMFKGPDGAELVRLSEVTEYLENHKQGRGGTGIDAIRDGNPDYGRGAILVVDDDAMVRGMVVQILQPLYPLHEAENGYEAIKLIKSLDDIRLVLLDIRMPGQSGIETYEVIMKIRPDVNVVIVSGYIEDVPDSMMADNAICGIIEKPVSEDLLLETVANSMDVIGSI